VRPDDVALLPAWIEVDEPPNGAMDEPTWESVGAVAATTTAGAMVEGGAALGLPVSRRGETPPVLAVIAARVGEAAPLGRPPLVVDLSSLWAGPLATRLLGAAGARVVKVESTARPDGARYGDAQFFDLLHAGKESVVLDLHTQAGLEHLHALVRAADVVVEASRPRALAQLGLDAHALLADGPRVWLSITGHGRADPHAERVAFGDDAAVAGGLVAEVDGGACFVADAVADPLTGVVAAAAVLDALGAGRRVLLDVALARVAAHVARAAAGAPWRVGTEEAAALPAVPEPRGRAPELGEHTESVLHELLG
jgi:crotonobetainyl-CoA:carnitine CoA-transferase CaiB-like acyl-CoA transferase